MLGKNKIMGFIPTKNSDVSKKFYEEVVGLRFIEDSEYALVFDANGIMIRIAKTEKFTPAPYTILGWEVSNIQKTMTELNEKGVHGEKYPYLKQDALGIWAAPDDGAKVAWFKDPDGNLLSITEFK